MVDRKMHSLSITISIQFNKAVIRGRRRFWRYTKTVRFLKRRWYVLNMTLDIAIDAAAAESFEVLGLSFSL